MATLWIGKCDRCGAEYKSGDETSRALFNMPEAPVTAYFAFHRRREDDRLSVDLCLPCGEELNAHLHAFFPEKFWNIKED